MRRDVGIAVFLVLATTAVYWPVVGHEFINFDDPSYVYQNAHVLGGLSAPGILWALGSTAEVNWHPLTWMSHMLDASLFGPWASGHHLISALLHAANTVLLFVLLRRMTGLRWPAAMVAALFALHPQHVESVAWVAERKDVLSTFFGLLALAAYVEYARRPSVWRYVPVFVLLALGLASKPMLVTLPCVMLLLDYWPLSRMGMTGVPRPVLPGRAEGDAASDTAGQGPPWHARFSRRTILRLVLEKVPLVALSAGSSVVTYIVQQEGGAMKLAGQLTFPTRVANALVAYAVYLGQMVWPAHLAVFYPYVERPLWQVLGATAILVLITALAVWQIRRRPYLAVGWFWYLGMLVPVIGLVQVGKQAMADRYTYIPLIGIFIAVAWGAADLLSGWRHRARVLAPAAAGVLAALAAVAFLQVRTWHDSETLYSHAIDVTENNVLAQGNLGGALVIRGQYAAAVGHYQEALRLEPNDAANLSNLGYSLANLGRLDEAIIYYRRAISLDPDNRGAHNNLGLALYGQGKLDEAVAEYLKVLRLNPDDADARTSVAAALVNQGKIDEAMSYCREALRLQPNHSRAHNNLGSALLAKGRLEEAAAEYREALRLDPNYPNGYYNLGVLLLRLGRGREAVPCLEKAIELRPNWVEALANLARLRAMAPEADLRNGPQAVAMAERACALTARREPFCLDTLAAAYAEVGRFKDAAAVAREALAVASAQGKQETVTQIEGYLRLYEAGKTARDRP